MLRFVLGKLHPAYFANPLDLGAGSRRPWPTTNGRHLSAHWPEPFCAWIDPTIIKIAMVATHTGGEAADSLSHKARS